MIVTGPTWSAETSGNAGLVSSSCRSQWVAMQQHLEELVIGRRSASVTVRRAPSVVRNQRNNISAIDIAFVLCVLTRIRNFGCRSGEFCVSTYCIPLIGATFHTRIITKPVTRSFHFSCTRIIAIANAQIAFPNTCQVSISEDHCCPSGHEPWKVRELYRVAHLLANLGWVDFDLGSSPGWWLLL